jgi:hypothetical protein
MIMRLCVVKNNDLMIQYSHSTVVITTMVILKGIKLLKETHPCIIR